MAQFRRILMFKALLSKDMAGLGLLKTTCPIRRRLLLLLTKYNERKSCFLSVTLASFHFIGILPSKSIQHNCFSPKSWSQNSGDYLRQQRGIFYNQNYFLNPFAGYWSQKSDDQIIHLPTYHLPSRQSILYSTNNSVLLLYEMSPTHISVVASDSVSPIWKG